MDEQENYPTDASGPSPATPSSEVTTGAPGPGSAPGSATTGSGASTTGRAGPRPSDLSSGFTAAVAGADWPATVAGTIEGAVTSVHDRFIRPMIVAARALVFGLIIATMALVLLVVLTVALIRLLTVYAFNGRVWPADLLVGGLFCIAGLAAWTQRTSRAAGR
jgi:hypothetical protein